MIDKVICLCVDKRKDMWGQLEADCEECTGLPFTKFIAGNGEDKELSYNHVDYPYEPIMNQYVGYSPANRIHINFNIFLCHRLILDENRNKNILLMEDDAQFIVDRWNTVWNSLELNDFFAGNAWDVLYIGYFQLQYEGDEVYGKDAEAAWRESGKVSIKRAQSNVPGKISGLQGVLLNKDFIPTLHNECKVSPLDGFINRNLNRFKVWYLEPQLIGVKSNYSYCEGSNVQRTEFWK